MDFSRSYRSDTRQALEDEDEGSFWTEKDRVSFFPIGIGITEQIKHKAQTVRF